MPQDGSGNYQYPLGTRGVPDETIESAAYNNFLDDLVGNDLNIARAIHRGGTGATTADAALVNLKAEKAAQLVDNYDSWVWFPGSFRSAIGANGAPPAPAGQTATSAFAGIVYINEPLANPPTNANVTVSARDMDDTVVPGRVYVREKKAGTWGAWVTGDASDKVSKSGGVDGIMTGFLTLNANPTALLHAATKQYVDTAIADALAAAVLPTTELRFTRASSQYMTRTFGSTSSSPWTLSTWVKRVGLATHQALFGVEIAGNKMHIGFGPGNQIILYGGSGGTTILATGSATYTSLGTWYNIVWSSATAAAAPVSKTFSVSINNGLEFSVSTADPGLNTTVLHYIGQPTFYPDVYMKEVIFVDGTALPPSTFGTSLGGVWTPKVYTGSYGTNGFKLSFSNQLSVANLGIDSGTNGNNWSAFNF